MNKTTQLEPELPEPYVKAHGVMPALYTEAQVLSAIAADRNKREGGMVMAEDLLRSVFTRPDLTEHGREQFMKDFMEGKEELTLCWGDFRMMAAKVRAAAPVSAGLSEEMIADLSKQFKILKIESTPKFERVKELDYGFEFRVTDAVIRADIDEAELIAFARALEARLRVLEDTALLNWLEQHDGRFHNIDRISAIVGVGFNRKASLREAIKEQIAAAPTTNSDLERHKTGQQEG